MNTTAKFLATTVATIALPFAALADGFYWNGDNATGALDDTAMWLYGAREDYTLTATNALPTAEDDVTVIGRTGKTSSITLASGHNFTAKNFYLGHGWGNVATLTTEGAVTIAGATEIGYYSDGHGTLIQNGGSWTTADLKLGTSNCTDCHLTVSNGTFTVNAGDGNPKIAESANSQAELLIDGGAMVINGNPICGHANGARANVTVSSGSLTVNGRYFNFGNKNTSVNTMTISGTGLVTVNCADYGLQLSGISAVNLVNGGTLVVPKTQRDGSTATDELAINFNGGVLKAYNNNGESLIGADAALTVNVLAGGAIVETDYNRTIAKAFSGTTGDGGFTKRGTGTLTLTATPGWNGPTTVEAGILKLASAPAGKDFVVVPATTSSASAPLQFTGSVDLSAYTIDVPEDMAIDPAATYYLYNTANVTAAPTLGSRLTAAGFTLNNNGSVYVPTVTTSDYYWKGGVDGNWETSGNWENAGGETVTSGHPGSGASDKIYVNASNDTAVALTGDYSVTHLYAGNAANANGFIAIDGTGSLTVSSTLNLGDAAAGSTGIVSVAGGKVFAPVNMKIGNNDGYGKLSIDGGEFNVTSSWVNVGNNNSSQEAAILEVNDGVAEIFVNYSSYGINMQGSSAEGKGKAYVNLNGGTLKTTRFYAGNGDKAGRIINLNGGTLMPLLANYNGGNFMPNDFTVNVLEGGAKFDTAGIDIEVKADLSGVGGITKSGEGKLNVSGASSFTGDVVVSNGVLALKTGTTSANYAVYPSADAAPLQIAGSVNLASDTMTILAEESELSTDVNYLLMTAQSITGVPRLANNFTENTWYLQNTGSALYLRAYHEGDDTNTYERAELSYSKSAYDAATKTWTDDSYSVHSDIGVGGDSIWKISGNYKNTATYTINVPADAEVHYVKFLNTVEAYSNTGTVSFVSSGAVCTLSTNVIDDTKRDIVVSISGHTAGAPITFTLTGLHTVMFDKIQIDYLAKPLTTAPVLKSWKVTDTSDRNHFALMLSYDRVMTNATATVNGTTTVEAEPGAVLLFPVWDLDYSSTATVNISSNDVKDIYGNKIASNLTFAVEIGAKPTATKEAPTVVTDFLSLSNAVAALNIENASATAARKVIYLRDGDYACESNRLFITGCNITFLGESTNVFIHGNTVLTSTTAPIQIEDSAKGIVFQNMVIRNDNTFRTGEFGGQSLAVKGGDHTVFDNVYLQSNQDTFLANGPLYYRGGEICGTVDFIYGDANMFFTNTTLTVEDRTGNVILAPGTSPTVEWGIVLAGCTIDAAPGAVNDLNGTFTLGRPWKSEPRGYYLNTIMKIVPSAGGWAGMSSLYTHMYEYGSVDAEGNPIDLSGRTCSSSSLNDYYPVLTAEEAAKITCRNVLDGRDSWDPTEHLADVAKPVLTVNGSNVSWEDDPYTSCYIVLADGAFAAATTANQYKATIGVKSVQVIALNASGTVGAASDAVPVKVPGLIISVW